MAILFSPPIHGLLRVTATLMTDQTAGANGEWIDIRQIRDFNIHITGVSGGDILQIRVSGTPTIPANNTHGVPLGFDITEEYMEVQRGSLYSWLKVYKSTGGNDTTNAYFTGEWIPLK